MAGLAGAVLCAATGFVLISLAWPKGSWFKSELLLKLSLGVGCGLGLFSFLYLLSLVFSVPAKTLAATEVVIFVLLSILLWIRGHNLHDQKLLQYTADMSSGLLGQTLRASFVVTLIGALHRCLKELATNPQGIGWDAFAIWNLHARFLFRGGEHWKDGFSSLIPWFHPDYPLFLPGSVAHFWSYLGRETTAVPATLAFAFTFSTVALLFSAVAVLRGRNHGLLAGLMLLGTPSFLRQGVSQYADIPLSFFLLAAIALLVLADRVPESNFSLLVLSGFMAVRGDAAGDFIASRELGSLLASNGAAGRHDHSHSPVNRVFQTFGRWSSRTILQPPRHAAESYRSSPILDDRAMVSQRFPSFWRLAFDPRDSRGHCLRDDFGERHRRNFSCR